MTTNGKINYIELPARDIEATKRFFSSAFGWGFVDYGPEYVSFQDAGLDGGTHGDDLVRVDALAPGLPEEALDGVLDLGHAAHAPDHEDLVDLHHESVFLQLAFRGVPRSRNPVARNVIAGTGDRHRDPGDDERHHESEESAVEHVGRIFRAFEPRRPWQERREVLEVPQSMRSSLYPWGGGEASENVPEEAGVASNGFACGPSVRMCEALSLPSPADSSDGSRSPGFHR